MRKIPAVMVSQHPDNAGKPHWHTEAYISDSYEVKECYLAFSKLDADEYKWDWEGKFVDESVFERLISEYYRYFQKNPLGKEKFLTFRLPDFRVETEFRLGRAFMAMVSAAGLAGKIGLPFPPMFEVILPMAESAEEIIAVQEAFREVAAIKHAYIKNANLEHIEIIPLFEDVGVLIRSSEILREYISLHKEKFGIKPKYIRPYLARSDTALAAGMVPSVVSIKIALSTYQEFEKETGIKLFPILGAGSLPFRGGISPITIKEFCNEYRGIYTTLVQSAFQYDFPVESVIEAIAAIKKTLPQKARHITSKQQKILQEIINIFSPVYQSTIKVLAPMIYSIATLMPARRERLKHTGILKYPRQVAGVKIPRAINFTASLYSIGIPPELIGTGRGIAKLKEQHKLRVLEQTYKGLRYDLEKAGRYLNKDVLRNLAKKSRAGREIMEDVSEIEKYLGHELVPITAYEKAHGVFASEIYDGFTNALDVTELIEEAAILRKSLG